ncbi:MAG: PEP-CTERM sorting domain-containing protein [Pirellulales bacterium]
MTNNNGTYDRIGTLPEIVPGPTWSYVPPAVPGGAGALQAAIRVPEPAEVVVQRPDSTWMKVYKVKLPASQAPDDPVAMQELLMQLISDANPENDQPDVPLNDIVPEGEDPAEVEAEWELLEGGAAPKEMMAEDDIDEENDGIVIRRYEFYKYTGPYDAEHEPTSLFLDTDLLEPPMGELGDFISANMVAAVLQPAGVPEPSTLLLGLTSVCWLLVVRRQRAG